LSASRVQAGPLDDELNRRIVRSSVWVGFGYGGSQILTFASTLVLVRILEPRDFGTVAVGLTLVAVISQIQESGLGAAFIHGRHRDPRVAAASVLVFAALAGVALTVVTVLVAPLYTRLLQVPESTPYVQALAALLAIRGLAVMPGAMLERALDFRSRTYAQFTGTMVQVAVAIGCAAANLGAWSLVAGLIAGASTQGAIFWLRAPSRPSPFAASRGTLRELLRYGRFVSGTNVMVVVNSNLDNAAVARFLGPASLGVYALAWRLAELPSTLIGLIVGRVMFSVYSRLQYDLRAVRAAYVQNLQRTTLLALPLTAALGIAAEPIVLGLLGSEWSGVIGPLRLLAVFGFIRLLVGPSGELFKGIGKPHLTLVTSIAFTVAAVPALLAFVPSRGPSGAALAMVIGISLSAVFALTLTFSALELRPVEFAISLARPAACAAIVAASLLVVLPTAKSLGPVPSLVLVTSVAAGTFLISLALIGRPLLVPIWTGLRRT
jgi:lipopolysaccharide exporter